MPDTSLSTRVTVRIVYLARLREALGMPGETLEVEGDRAITVDTIVGLLRARGGAWADVLAAGRAVRFAVNHRVAAPAHVIADGDEVAIFPPVTGG